MIRSHPVKSPEAYGFWALQNRFCWCCGIPYYAAAREFRGLSTHHIIKSGRSDEFENLMRLCLRCHNAAEGQEPGGLPSLPLGVCLTIKKEMDPFHWNPERLTVLYHKNLPDLIPIPVVYDREFRRWNPSGRLLLRRSRSSNPATASKHGKEQSDGKADIIC